jgi:murein DD-endopeptidase MepM/ murein hydrolase activator NlpD
VVSTNRLRGFADLFTAALALYGMIVSTPLGGITVRTWHWVTGQKHTHRPLLGYFETETSGPTARPPPNDRARPVLTFQGNALNTVPPAAVIAPSGLPPSLARSLALMLANGHVADGANFDITISPPIRQALLHAGVRPPDEKSTAADRERAIFDAVARLEERLKSDEAAVAALAVDLDDLRFALAMARATDAPNAGRYEVFRTFLPPQNRAEVDDLVDGTFALSTAFAFRSPLPRSGVITSRFGVREDPLYHAPGVHGGLDISAPLGTEIHAIADGRVLVAAHDAANGRFLRIDHGHGLVSVYCHASKLEVHHDAIVKKGDVIARVGATGRATGPHLHLQIELNREPIDPEIFLPNGRGP